MFRKLLLLTIVILIPLLASGQTKFGPSVNVGFSFFDKTSKNLDIKGGICPSFGVTMQNDINYWFSLKTSLLYSFSQIKTTSTPPGGVNDQIKGQFIDLIIAGRFSAFDNTSKVLPYGVAGLGNSFNIVGKGAENYLAGLSFKSYVPYFTVGLGTGIKMTFLSQIDISLNYNRYLAPVIVFPDGSDARMNMVVLKLSGLF
jgi:hypothetical protein